MGMAYDMYDFATRREWHESLQHMLSSLKIYEQMLETVNKLILSRRELKILESLENSNHKHGEGGMCPICTDEYVEGDAKVRTACGHEFHRECLKKWLKQGDTCPMCRAELMSASDSEDSPDESSQLSDDIRSLLQALGLPSNVEALLPFA